MTADTGMTDKKKLQLVARLSALIGSGTQLIHNGSRSQNEVETLLDCLQAFKEGQLAGAVRRAKKGKLEDYYKCFDVETASVPMPDKYRKAMEDCGIRYVGEAYYVYRGRTGQHYSVKKRWDAIIKIFAERFNIPLECDPLAMGWVPPYWGDTTLAAELNVLILERCPTPEVNDWPGKLYDVNMTKTHLERLASDLLNRRGIARREHSDNKKHFIGELVPDHRGDEMPTQGKFVVSQRNLKACSSSLWAGHLLPDGWLGDNAWCGDLWSREFDDIENERAAIAAALPYVQNAIRRNGLDEGDYHFEYHARTRGLLAEIGLQHIPQLVSNTREQLLRLLTEQQVRKVEARLEEHYLHLGMTVDEIEKILSRHAREHLRDESEDGN